MYILILISTFVSTKTKQIYTLFYSQKWKESAKIPYLLKYMLAFKYSFNLIFWNN